MSYYHRYRGGRGRRRARLRIVLLALALVILCAIAALFFLQDGAIFTADGFHFSFGKKDDPAPSGQDSDPADLPDVPLEIEDPSGTNTGENTGSGTEPQTPAEPLRALLLPGTDLLTGDDLTSAAESAHCTALAFQIKGPDGLSLVDDGAQNGVSDQAEAFSQALSALDGEKAAVLSALRDDVRPRAIYRASALHTQSGATWLDREYIAWFDPMGRDTLSSLAAQIEACRAAGFTQVVLQNFSFPTAGKLDLIDLGDTLSRPAALTALAQALRERCPDVPLGMILTEAAAENFLDGTSGQDVAELAQYFDVLYVPAADFSADLSALDSAAEGTGCRIGLYVTGVSAAPAELDRPFLLAEN